MKLCGLREFLCISSEGLASIFRLRSLRNRNIRFVNIFLRPLAKERKSYSGERYHIRQHYSETSSLKLHLKTKTLYSNDLIFPWPIFRRTRSGSSNPLLSGLTAPSREIALTMATRKSHGVFERGFEISCWELLIRSTTGPANSEIWRQDP